MPKSDTTFEEFESRKDTYRQLYEALVNEDSPLIHGIYGMPGVGKTRMMEKFWEDAMDKQIFDKVVRVNVGNENMDKMKLQDQIAGRLNCHLNSQDVDCRASQLENSLRNGRRVLLILDDVWSEIRLGDIIGTSFGDGSSSKGSKILFTSREKVVLLHNKCEHLVEIKTLSPDEALYLFENTVGHDTINSLQDESLVQKVCDECGELPLLIHAVGKALKGSPHNSWKDAHDQLQKGKFEKIVGVDPHVYACIKLSIDNLKDDDAKSCLFLCSFFPEDANIDMAMLIQLATGSQLIPDGESRILAMVHYLKISSLLLDSGKNHETKVHDIIRDVARSIASTDSKYAFLQVTCNSGYLPSNANYQTRKFLRLDTKTADVFFIEDLECLHLHTLWLQSNNHPQTFLGGFFSMFGNLSFLMLQKVTISLEKFSLQPLGKLETLSILKCDMRKTDVNLFPKSLKSLWIYDCDLPRLLDVKNLKYLRKLEIKQGSVFEMGSNVISSLSSLEELHVPNGIINDSEEYHTEPIAMEISRLTNLTSLNFCFYFEDTFQGTKIFSNVDRYNIIIGGSEMFGFWGQHNLVPSGRWIELYGNYWKSWESLIARAEKMRLKHSDIELSSICNGHKRAFQDLKALYILQCHQMGYLATRSQDEIEYSRATCFSKLTILEIDSCSKLKYLFCNKIAKSMAQLQELRVKNCKSLEAIILNDRTSISDDEIQPPTYFSKLTILDIHNCSKLKYLFCKNISKSLVRLQELRLSDCKSMEAIILNDGTSDAEIINCARLKMLKMSYIEGLTSFYAEERNTHSAIDSKPLFDGTVAFPSLEKLVIKSLPVGSVIWAKECNSDTLSSFGKLNHLTVSWCDRLEIVIPQAMLHRLNYLESIDVNECSSLRSMFPPSVAIDLTHLKKMSISCCRKMKEIIETGEQVITEGGILFPELTCLHLYDLRSLTSFWCYQKGKANTCKVPLRLLRLTSIVLKDLIILERFFHGSYFEFHVPALKEVRVINCMLSTLFTLSMFKNFQLEHLEVRECKFLESIFEDARGDETLDTRDKIITLNQVSEVSLESLPKCKSIFYGASYKCYMPALKNVKIVGCGLSVLFTSSVFRETQQLEELYVKNCNSMEHIVEEVGDDETSQRQGESIEFPKLSSICLESLPSLKSFSCSPSYVFNMPKLHTLRLTECPQIEYFSSSKTNTQEVCVFIDRCIEVGIQDLNDCIERNHKRATQLGTRYTIRGELTK